MMKYSLNASMSAVFVFDAFIPLRVHEHQWYAGIARIRWSLFSIMAIKWFFAVVLRLKNTYNDYQRQGIIFLLSSNGVR